MFYPWIFSYSFFYINNNQSTIIKTKRFYIFSGKSKALINLLDPHSIPSCLSLWITVVSVFIACFLSMCFFLLLFLLAAALSFRAFVPGVFNPGENSRINNIFLQHKSSCPQPKFWMNQEFSLFETLTLHSQDSNSS